MIAAPHRRLCWSAALLGLAMHALACGDLATTMTPTDGGAGAQDGGDSVGDAAGPAPDVGLPPTPEGTVELIPDLGRSEDPADPLNAGSCYDGLDNDGDAPMEGMDCADPGCATLPSCCVGSAEAACCVPLDGAGFDATALSPCEGGDPTSCLPNAEPFGAPRPIVAGGLLLGGDGRGDSGLLLTVPHDLRTERLVLRGEIAQARECAIDCLESVAFGVTAQTRIGDEGLVDPSVALVVSGARREALLVVGGAVAARWPEVDDETWTLELRPTGEVWVARGSEAAHPVASYVPFASGRVVAWGHTRNPSATDDRAARLRALTVTPAVCDVPSAWRERTPLRIEDSLPLDTRGASGPTMAMDGDTPVLVYEWQGALYAARASTDPTRYFVTTAAPEEALLRPEPGEEVHGPELVVGPGGLTLYYVTTAAGTSELRRARIEPGTTALGEPVVCNASRGFGASEIADPTLVPIAPPGRPERWAMVLRVGAKLVAFASVDGIEWTEISTIPTSALHADEVREPSLVVVNGGYQLFVSVRHGTRWRQALFASAELLYWRLVSDRALEGHGDGGEALGVRDLDAQMSDATMEVVYLGLDGTQERLYHATRPIPQRL